MRLGFLGPSRVIAGTGPEIRLPAGRHRVVLAALAVRANQIVPVDELADVLWNGSPPAGAVRTIRVYVARLRAVLGGEAAAHLLTRAPGYLWHADPGEIDLEAFARLCRDGGAALRSGDWSGSAGLLSDALELWRGVPLVDIPSDRLRDREVPRLERLRTGAVEGRITADLHLGRHGEVITELRELLAAEPLREPLHALLMLALHRDGRQGEALAAYQAARRILIDELGTDPGPVLRHLHQQILDGDPQLAAGTDSLLPATDPVPGSHPADGPLRPVPAQLPRDIAGFTGRRAELAVLDRLLGPPDRALPARAEGTHAVVICAVSGTAGVGKTALAVHWAHRVGGRFPDGQLYVNLRGFHPGGQVLEPAAAVRGVLDALGVPKERIPVDIDAQAALYRSLLTGKRILVVIDNARDAEHARPLLPGTPTALAVVTSRDQLTPLVAADGARPVAVDLLTDDEARDLLDRRIGEGRVAAEPAAAEQITAACARLPLALALVAARAATNPGFRLADLADELSSASDRAGRLDAGDILSQVRAVFSWSYRTLTPPAARLFRLLGLHPGPDTSAPAAASLIGHASTDTRRLLAELTRAGLLTEHRPGRYGSHDLLAAYAADLTQAVDSDDERRAATTRLLDHYTRTAHTAARLLNPTRDPIQLPLALPAAGATPEQPADHQAALAWLTAEHPNLLTAQQLATETGFDTHTWQLAWALNMFLDRRGHWHDLASTSRSALAAANRLSHPAATAYAHRQVAQASTQLRDYDQAHTHLRHALDLHTEAGDLDGQAHVHITLGILWERQNRPDLALTHCQQALILYRATGHRRGQALALNGVGWDYALLGDHTRALTQCQQALTLHRQAGDRDGEAATWDSLGYAHHHLAHHAQAVDCYQHALTLYRDLGDRYNEADTLTHLGDTHHAAGQPDAARTAWTDALHILSDLDHPHAAAVLTKLTTLDLTAPRAGGPGSNPPAP